ncbi:unnamed protein product [Cylicocyclus nassatus]|uniref:Uncharacterized protein n=1 Tax=Cylicocyclus nassatus TaxID=53992 RepID=A0AA36MEP8_CYLNA|nr:unnamed protein product [Cylicocyclus nassatus]
MSSDECASIHQITPARPRHRAITRVCVISDDPQKDESPSELDNDDGKESLYEDRFCKVTETDIFVKCYYFPCGSQARIPLQDIKSLRIQAQTDECSSIAWGSVDDVIWWAFDSKRRLRAKPYCNVVIRETRRPYLVGFTIRDRKNFENVLRHLQSIRIS